MKSTFDKLKNNINHIKRVIQVFVFHYIGYLEKCLKVSEEVEAIYTANGCSLCGIPLFTTQNRADIVPPPWGEHFSIMNTDFPSAQLLH